MADESRQHPPGEFSGRFVLVIVTLCLAYAAAMWFVCGGRDLLLGALAT